jgi:hypothetical protein
MRRVKRSLSSKAKLSFITASMSLIKRFGLSEFFLRVANALSERQPYLYDLYRKGERLVEYAWILRNLDRNDGRVLDIGCQGTLFQSCLPALATTW